MLTSEVAGNGGVGRGAKVHASAIGWHAAQRYAIASPSSYNAVLGVTQGCLPQLRIEVTQVCCRSLSLVTGCSQEYMLLWVKAFACGTAVVPTYLQVPYVLQRPLHLGVVLPKLMYLQHHQPHIQHMVFY
jgi:hypothetical protein